MKIQLKQKRMKLLKRQTPIESEELALVNILKKYESDYRTTIKDKWLSVDTSLPPNTDSIVVIYDSETGSRTLYPAHVFLKHYLMDRFHYKWSRSPLFKNISHFMVLSDPK